MSSDAAAALYGECVVVDSPATGIVIVISQSVYGNLYFVDCCFTAAYCMLLNALSSFKGRTSFGFDWET